MNNKKKSDTHHQLATLIEKVVSLYDFKTSRVPSARANDFKLDSNQHCALHYSLARILNTECPNVKPDEESFIQFADSKIQELLTQPIIEKIPQLIIQGRFIPENAACLLYYWLEYLKKKEKLTISTPNLRKVQILLGCRSNRISNLQNAFEYGVHPPQYRLSYMSEKFKPYPPFPHVNLDVINKILKEAEQAIVKKEELNSLEAYYDLLKRLEDLAGVSETDVKQFRQRKRGKERAPTLTAVYKGLQHAQRKEKLHKSLHHYRKYNRLLLQAGRLRGRMKTIFNPYMTALCARVDKSGFASFIPQEEIEKADPLTLAWLCLTVAEFSVRKGFTLVSQQQGGLNEIQKHLLELLTESKTTNWKLVACIHPIPEIMKKLSKQDCLDLLNRALQLQIPMAKFLDAQWKLGVVDCAKKGMMVPRRGSEIDSSGWNVVCGAWNNMIRFIRAINATLDTPPPLILKCMKLLAADQMRWAMIEGKDEQLDIKVFVTLADSGITPWGIVLNTCKCTIDDVIKACKKNSVDPQTWLRIPKNRSMDLKESHDMICGVCVPNNAFMVNLLKTLGAYGYKPPKQQ